MVGISNLHDKKGCEMDISMLLPHFKTIVDVVKENNSSLSLNNNFEGVETIDVFAANQYGHIWTDYMVYENGKWIWNDFGPDFWMIAPKVPK